MCVMKNGKNRIIHGTVIQRIVLISLHSPKGATDSLREGDMDFLNVGVAGSLKPDVNKT